MREKSQNEQTEVKIVEKASKIATKIFTAPTELITINSPTKPEVKGNPIFAKIKIKKKNEKIGISLQRFFRYKIFLVPFLSYNIPIQEKSAAETIPWLIIRNILPCKPSKLQENKPITTNDICAIDEYAIIFFKSVCLIAIHEI